LCSKLSRMLGGKLSVRSIEGKGSTFSFSLPLSLDLGGRKLEEHRPLSPKVLILDQTNNDLLAELLKLKGVQAHVTGKPLEALTSFEAEEYDLIFVDLMDQKSIEFAHKVRGCFKGEMTPMVGIADSELECHSALKIELNLDEVVERPLKGKDLTKFISNKVSVRDRVNEVLSVVV